MSKVLVLSSYYLGTATANGICAKNIARQLKQNGHEVFVVCYDKGEAEENVYTVSCPATERKRSLVTKIYGRLRAAVTPTLNRSLIREYTTVSLNLCEEKGIDIVVGMFFPFETAPVLQAIKKRFPRIHTVIYELDSVGDGIFSGSRYQALVNHAIERWSGKQYRYADRVIVMESHEDYWKKTFGKKYGDKLMLADIPVLTEKPLPRLEKSKEEPISFLYGGLIEQAYRSPDHLLDLFEEYSKTEKATLDFFSKGDCEEKIAERAKRVSGIRRNGYVSETALNEAIAKADVLVSIGNRFSRSVPSKLITYLSYGKPVVHISLQKDDVCAHYLEKYPSGLVLYSWDPVKENVEKLRQFTEENRYNTIDFTEVAAALVKNDPAYSAHLIADDK